MDPVELLYERDVARTRINLLEDENQRLKMLLRYAEEAVQAEYQRAEPSTSSKEAK